MKIINYILANLLVILLLTACNEGIDPITQVAPGEDKAAPSVKINYPTEGLEIFIEAPVTTVNLQAEVSDDIELKSMSFTLDNTELQSYSNFKDYRRAVEAYNYDKLANGDHIFTVKAEDMTGKITTKSVNFKKLSRYVPKYNGEIFYMPFNDNHKDLVSEVIATKSGNPLFADGKSGLAYKGAEGGYLSFPTVDAVNSVNLLGAEFSAAFWYKVNAIPDRAGILVISPKDAPPTGEANNMTNGFRLFREAGNGVQAIKLNVGNGSAGNWFDGAAATIAATNTDWNFIAFTISTSKCVIYLNGDIVAQGSLPGGVAWNGGCESLSIMSGAPYFIGWNHLSDLSLMDELRIFNKALTQEEIQTIMNAPK